ncbi:hypothetical protein [Aliiroseovarius sp.]|uniref:hypothetical protein n=1 Tax=Aliiroseovarius sp. TaxID=1872442 RepID=UPI00260913B8|nr:hypothetical protein [Aliiroseovarius sp.]
MIHDPGADASKSSVLDDAGHRLLLYGDKVAGRHDASIARDAIARPGLWSYWVAAAFR